MECEVCGHELNFDGTCDYCRQTRSVRVMERWEDADYAETSIEDVEFVDEGSTGERPQDFQRVYEDNSSQGSAEEDFRKHFRGYGGDNGSAKIFTFGFGNGNSGITKWQLWKYKLMGGLVLAAVAAILLVVALPLAVIGVIAALMGYGVYKFLK